MRTNFKLQLFKNINSCKVWIINWSNSHLGLCEFVNHFPLKFNVFGVFLNFQGNVNDVNGLFLLFSSMLKKKQRTIVRHKQPIDLFCLSTLLPNSNPGNYFLSKWDNFMLAGSLSNEQRFKPPWYRHMFSCYYAWNHAQGRLYMKTRSRRLCGTRGPGWL